MTKLNVSVIPLKPMKSYFVKSQRSSSQMSAFLVDGKMITDKTDILNMWADPVETLGTPSHDATYDKSFFQKVSCRVTELFSIFSGNLYLFKLYEKYFSECRTCSSIKTGQILPLFKGKGTKVSNTGNYRGITIFPTLCKVYELILL